MMAISNWAREDAAEPLYRAIRIRQYRAFICRRNNVEKDDKERAKPAKAVRYGCSLAPVKTSPSNKR